MRALLLVVIFGCTYSLFYFNAGHIQLNRVVGPQSIGTTEIFEPFGMKVQSAFNESARIVTPCDIESNKWVLAIDTLDLSTLIPSADRVKIDIHQYEPEAGQISTTLQKYPFQLGACGSISGSQKQIKTCLEIEDEEAYGFEVQLTVDVDGNQFKGKTKIIKEIGCNTIPQIVGIKLSQVKI